MPDTQLLNIIKQDYLNLLNEHVTVFVESIEKIFNEYPQIDALSFGQKSFVIQGASLNKSNAVTEKNFGSYQKEQNVKYYAYTQDSNGQDVRVLTLLQEYESLFDAYYQITSNPHFKLLSLENTYSAQFSKKDLKKSVAQFFGKECAQYWAAFKEKTLIEGALDNKPSKKSAQTNPTQPGKAGAKLPHKV